MASYRVFRRHRDTTFLDVAGMRPIALPAPVFGPRSLVGMSETHKRRLFGREIEALPKEKRAANLMRLYRKYRIGERLRPCLICQWAKCKLPCDVCCTCDGSGVLPARGK